MCFFLAQIFYQEKSRLFYRHDPPPGNCGVELTPMLSEPVDRETIEVSKFTLDGSHLSVTLSWVFPENVYGEIQSYDVRFTIRPLPSEKERAETDELVIQRSFEVSQYN